MDTELQDAEHVATVVGLISMNLYVIMVTFYSFGLHNIAVKRFSLLLLLFSALKIPDFDFFLIIPTSRLMQALN